MIVAVAEVARGPLSSFESAVLVIHPSEFAAEVVLPFAFAVLFLRKTEAIASVGIHPSSLHPRQTPWTSSVAASEVAVVLTSVVALRASIAPSCAC